MTVIVAHPHGACSRPRRGTPLDAPVGIGYGSAVLHPIIWLYVLVLPLQRVWTLPWLGQRLQPPELVGLAVMAVAGHRLATSGPRPRWHLIDSGAIGWWACVTLAAAIAVGRGTTPASAVAGEWLGGTYLVLLFFALRVLLLPAHLEALARALVLSVAAAGSLGLVGAVAGSGDRRLLAWAVEQPYPYMIAARRAQGLTAGPTMLASLLIAGLFAIPITRWSVRVKSAAAALLLAALAATYSKSAAALLAGALMSCACLAAGRRRVQRLLVAAAACVAVAFVAATHFVVSTPAAAQELTARTSIIGSTPALAVPVAGRELFVYPTNYVVNRRTSVAAIRTTWPGGLGPGGHNAFVRREVAEGRRDRRTAQWSDPHSTYLGIAAELGLAGILGFLALAAAIGLTVRRGWRAVRDGRGSPSARLALALLTGALAALAIDAAVTDVMNFRHAWVALAALAVWAPAPPPPGRAPA